jgi:hypothetical protein
MQWFRGSMQLDWFSSLNTPTSGGSWNWTASDWNLAPAVNAHQGESLMSRLHTITCIDTLPPAGGNTRRNRVQVSTNWYRPSLTGGAPGPSPVPKPACAPYLTPAPAGLLLLRQRIMHPEKDPRS